MIPGEYRSIRTELRRYYVNKYDTKIPKEIEKERAEKERTKAWRKGKVSHADEEE